MSNFSSYLQYLLLILNFCVKTRTRFSLRDKRLFEIIEAEITRVDCISKVYVKFIAFKKLIKHTTVPSSLTRVSFSFLDCAGHRRLTQKRSYYNIQSNFNGSNTFGIMKISSRQG